MPAAKKKNKKNQIKKAKPRVRKGNLFRIESAKKNVVNTLDQINRVLSRFEGEVEGLVKKIVKQSERSRKELRKNFEELLTKVKADHLEKEIRRRAEDILGSIREIESLFKNQKMAGIFESAKEGFDNVVEILTENNWVIQARQTAKQARREAFSLLSIPTHEEVIKLEKKLVSLEKRISNLSRKAA